MIDYDRIACITICVCLILFWPYVSYKTGYKNGVVTILKAYNYNSIEKTDEKTEQLITDARLEQTLEKIRKENEVDFKNTYKIKKKGIKK